MSMPGSMWAIYVLREFVGAVSRGSWNCLPRKAVTVDPLVDPLIEGAGGKHRQDYSLTTLP